MCWFGSADLRQQCAVKSSTAAAAWSLWQLLSPQPPYAHHIALFACSPSCAFFLFLSACSRICAVVSTAPAPEGTLQRTTSSSSAAAALEPAPGVVAAAYGLQFGEQMLPKLEGCYSCGRMGDYACSSHGFVCGGLCRLYSTSCAACATRCSCATGTAPRMQSSCSADLGF